MEKSLFDKYTEMKALHWLVGMCAVLSFCLSLSTLWYVSCHGNDQFGMAVASIQFFVALAAFGGFWMLRGAAVSASKDAAREEFSNHQSSLKREIMEQVSNDTKGLVNDALKDYLHTEEGKQLIHEVVLNKDMLSSLNIKQTEGTSDFPNIDDPNRVSFNFKGKKKKGVFTIPNNDYEAPDV